MTKKDEIIDLLGECSLEERLEVFNHLRKAEPIHAIEAKLNTTAEVIKSCQSRLFFGESG